MASSSKSSSKNVAIGKRAKIDSAQRYMLIFVGIASVVIGVTIVAVIYFAKTIAFNNKLITAKDEVIKIYESTQNNLSSISNQISGLSTNEYLESVGRMSRNDCQKFQVGIDGVPENVSLSTLEDVRECSALRVITDALPYTKNQDTALTSFYILLMRAEEGASIDSLSATDIESGEAGLSMMKINADFIDDPDRVLNSLVEIEKSIRDYVVDKANLAYGFDEETGSSSLTLTASYKTYFADKAGLISVQRTVCAKETNEKCTAAGGDNSIKELGLEGQ
jgi:hypothetical protein